MHPNATTIARFYESFAALDAEGMAACYQKDVVFSDPVFGDLRGDAATNMWRMLTRRAKDLSVVASDIHADEATGSARWVATYTFGKTGRKVRNVIDARFTFRDGLIAEHHDTFDLWKWSGMALGPAGKFLGWTPMMQSRIRADARRGLESFIAKRAAPA